MSKRPRRPWPQPCSRPGYPPASSSFPTSQTVLFLSLSDASVLPYSPSPTPAAAWDKHGQAPWVQPPPAAVGQHNPTGLCLIRRELSFCFFLSLFPNVFPFFPLLSSLWWFKDKTEKINLLTREKPSPYQEVYLLRYLILFLLAIVLCWKPVSFSCSNCKGLCFLLGNSP